MEQSSVIIGNVSSLINLLIPILSLLLYFLIITFHGEKKVKFCIFPFAKQCAVGVKYPSFLSDFNETWNLATYFRKILKCKIYCEPDQWESSCSMRTDRQAGRHAGRQAGRSGDAFRSFAKARGNERHHNNLLCYIAICGIK
jgi:hypothetical protein